MAAYCPITDLENADKAYEFVFGGLPANGQTVSRELATAFAGYQSSLNLTGLDGQALTADRYQDYLLATYLQPAATTYLAGLSDQERSTYLSTNPWIQWNGGKATFTVADYLTHLGSRKKTERLRARDAGENISSGHERRHFTDKPGKDTGGAAMRTAWTARSRSCGETDQKNPNRAKNYFLRVGTSDTDTAPIFFSNLAAGLHGLGDNVDSLMYWDAGHGTNDDREVPGVGEHGDRAQQLTGARPRRCPRPAASPVRRAGAAGNLLPRRGGSSAGQSSGLIIRQVVGSSPTRPTIYQR